MPKEIQEELWKHPGQILFVNMGLKKIENIREMYVLGTIHFRCFVFFDLFVKC